MNSKSTLGLAAASMLVSSTLFASTLTLDFSSAGSGGVLDSAGADTGFSTRLIGTGGSLPTNDPNLTLNTGGGVLTLTTQQSDFNGGAGLAIGSMPGVNLSTLGFTGAQDFTVTANFAPIPALMDIDQVGIYIGQNGANLTRAGLIVFGGTPEYFSGHTTAAADNNGRFFGFGLNVADGLTVSISRTAGNWTYLIDGNEWQPNTVGNGSGTNVDPDGSSGAPNLNALSNLTVGVYGITPLNVIAKTITLDSFTVSVVPEPSTYAALAGVAALALTALRRRRTAR
jgi:arabinan endo-1,5-alpha-L-arabinosidase